MLPNYANELEPASHIALPWILRLRYAMSMGQAAAILLARFTLGLDLPLPWMLPVPALLACTNYWLAWRARQPEPMPTPNYVFGMLALDAFGLTVLLMMSGGANNPFSLLYLVNVTLSATILTKRQTWWLGLISALGFGALFLLFRPIPQLALHHSADGGKLHLVGMWVGFNVTALLVALFSARISQLLREHERSLLDMQQALAKKDRLASLATLAAGAAHELSTPLGTIAIVAREVERAAEAMHPAIAADSRLIRSEVNRCRAILERLSVRGAAPGGEAPETIGVDELLRNVSTAFSGVQGLSVSLDCSDVALSVPRQAVEQALGVLIRNALDACPDRLLVDVSAQAPQGSVRFLVQDRGTGMSAETLRRIGEPFFTTKEVGKGMGLGIFLVRGLADQLGGSLTFTSLEGHGTTAVLELPAVITETLVYSR